MTESHLVCAILTRDDAVLALRKRGGDADLERWVFPTAPISDGETAQDALAGRICAELQIACSTSWDLDSVRASWDGRDVTLECVVACLAPDVQPTITALSDGCDALRWLRRDELFDVSWEPAHRRVMELLGLSWDQMFMFSHL